MAQPASNPRIEELRFKLKTDPKSRLFYPLAEELRKAGHAAEAEQVLRSGLEAHGTYLSAWVSLGRVLREQKKDGEAIEALQRALQLDPGNVVAARLLGDAHLAVGDKVEAIKKYKLVHALMPGDEELEGTIATLDRELNPIAAPPEPLPAAPAAPVPESEAAAAPAIAEPAAEPEVVAAAPEAPAPEPFAAAPFAAAENESPFAEETPFAEERQESLATGDAEPMLAAHEESPFEEPVADFTAAAASIESPSGFQIEEAPLAAELPAPAAPAEEADVFAPVAAEPFATESPVAEPPADDLTNTITMADLYVRQGLTDDARHIYENILARHPENDVVRGKLAALDAVAAPAPASDAIEAPPPPGATQARIDRLQSWLSKMKRSEAGGV